MQVITEEWGRDLIGSGNKHGWYTAPQRVAAKIAQIVRAQPDEVVVADSTSINLFKVAAAALRLRPERRVILSGPHACIASHCRKCSAEWFVCCGSRGRHVPHGPVHAGGVDAAAGPGPQLAAS